jgi:glycosyltransferase involved in cell wall biosynthesis
MQEAAFLVLPSLWYENFPMTLLEAYATGLPVIGSAIGSLVELIEDYGTGRHFRAGDASDLAAVLAWAFSHPTELGELGRGARREFELKYTATRNYDQLLSIYRAAREHGRAIR